MTLNSSQMMDWETRIRQRTCKHMNYMGTNMEFSHITTVTNDGSRSVWMEGTFLTTSCRNNEYLHLMSVVIQLVFYLIVIIELADFLCKFPILQPTVDYNFSVVNKIG